MIGLVKKELHKSALNVFRRVSKRLPVVDLLMQYKLVPVTYLEFVKMFIYIYIYI